MEKPGEAELTEKPEEVELAEIMEIPHAVAHSGDPVGAIPRP